MSNQVKFVVAVFFMAIFIFGFGMAMKVSLPEEKPSAQKPPQESFKDSYRNHPITEPPVAQSSEKQAVLESPPLPPPKNRRDVIPNEQIFRFKNAADLQKFLAAARVNGLEPLGVLDKLNAVRIRFRTKEQLSDALSQSPQPKESSNNYFVRMPTPPENESPENSGVYSPFGARAMEWLGVPSNHAQWGKGVTVAILDTGIESHPTFAGKNITHVDLIDGANKSVPYHGHGTAVASIVAGSRSDAPGMAPAATLLDIRVMPGDGIGMKA
jgi:subtilisin family serine protease